MSEDEGEDETGDESGQAGEGPEFVPLNWSRLVHAARATVDHMLAGHEQAAADELGTAGRAELQYVALTLAGWMVTASRAAGVGDDDIRERLDQVVADALADDLLGRHGGDQHGGG